MKELWDNHIRLLLEKHGELDMDQKKTFAAVTIRILFFRSLQKMSLTCHKRSALQSCLPCDLQLAKTRKTDL